MYTQFVRYLVILLWLVKSIDCQDGSGSKPIVNVDGVEKARIEDYPYQAAILLHDQVFCGGSIVCKMNILTAAHCVSQLQNVNHLTVRVGSSEYFKGESYGVKRIHIHPKFNLSSMEYDVAALQLKTPLKFSKRVKPITLAKTRVPDSAKVNVTGWGITSADASAMSSVLNVVTVQTINQDTCRKQYKDLIPITKSMVCAGLPGGGKGPSLGDSGGPLVDILTGKQIGVVSFAGSSTLSNLPAVYASIPDALENKSEIDGNLEIEDIFKIADTSKIEAKQRQPLLARITSQGV